MTPSLKRALQSGKGRGGIGECRRLADRARERLDLVGSRFDAVFGSHSAKGGRQHVPVAPVRTGFGGRFVDREPLEDFVSRELAAAAPKDRHERIR